VLSKKDDIVNKLGDNHKKLAVDLEQQKELFKKLQDGLTEQSKQYNEIARTFKA
jgi:hypothetical protein